MAAAFVPSPGLRPSRVAGRVGPSDARRAPMPALEVKNLNAPEDGRPSQGNGQLEMVT